MVRYAYRSHLKAKHSLATLLTLAFVLLFAASGGASVESGTNGESAINGTDSPACSYGEITNNSPPVVSGNVALGSTLSTTAGTWTSCQIPLTSTAYQWLRDGLPVGVNSNTYIVGASDVGHTFSATVTACNAESCLSRESDASLGSPALLSDGTNSFTFANHDGIFTIYKTCLGPTAHGGQNITVGPAYIARADRINGDGTTTRVIDDERASNYIYGGLGTFGFHAARKLGAETTLTGNVNSWWAEGRECAYDQAQPGITCPPSQTKQPLPIPCGVGVSDVAIVDQPFVAGGILYFNADVNFIDPYVPYGGTPLLTVRYRYQVNDSQIRLWGTVTQHAPYNSSSNAFIKEPKFEFRVSGGGYTRLSAVLYGGALGVNQVNYGTHPYCAFMGHNPVTGTGQCDDNDRFRGRFDYGQFTDLSSTPRCGPAPNPVDTCLNVVGRAALPDNPGATTFYWEARGYGMDQWAHLDWPGLPPVTRFGPRSQSLDGNCTHLQNPIDPQEEQYVRRWELVGGLDNNIAGQPYLNASLNFHGWEGWDSAYHCPALSFNDNRAEVSWGSYYSISFGPGFVG